jgi:mannan endo-1,4-beta-mannosidase
MDRYVTQILGSGQSHNSFYTNSAVQTAYKNYIKAFVGRYANEPTIMAWQLANEPRCSGCTATLTKWASDISAVRDFLKSFYKL